MTLSTMNISVQVMPLTVARGSAINSRHQTCRSESGLTGRESPPRERGRPLSLGEMFKAPKGIMFQGNFEAAKEKALERSMWLVHKQDSFPCLCRLQSCCSLLLTQTGMQLVNLQANKEFASHQLNRDTWGDVTLQDILKGSFIFLQASPYRALLCSRLQAVSLMRDLGTGHGLDRRGAEGPELLQAV